MSILLQWFGASHKEGILFTKEYRELAGLRSHRMWLLAGALFLTLVALGHALGGREELKARMSDPFTNWVNVPVVRGLTKEDVTDVRNLFSNEALLDSFGLRMLSSHVIWKEIFQASTGETFQIRGRSLSSQTPLQEAILAPENLIINRNISNECAIIVKKDLLHLLGYTVDQLMLPIVLEQAVIYVPIKAVVRTLPDRCDFTSSEKLYRNLTMPFHKTGFVEMAGETNQLTLINRTGRREMETLLQKRFPLVHRLDIESLQEAEGMGVPLLTLILKDFINVSEREELIKELEVYFEGQLQPYLHYDCGREAVEVVKPHYLSFHFHKLDRIRSFRDLLQSHWEIEVDMSQVEAKGNFALLSQITGLLGGLLFVFALIGLILYLHSFFRSHLERNKPYLGSLMAFGLEGRWLKKIYLSIAGYLLCQSGFIALLGVSMYGLLMNFLQRPFLFFDVRIFMALITILCITLWTISKFLQRIFSKTPGDLIYRRE